jgi:hypothetical protein
MLGREIERRTGMESTTSATNLVRERQFRRNVWWAVFLVSPPLAIATYVLIWKAAVWVFGW